MDCRIVFYAARKTSFCERSLKKSFSELGISASNTAFVAGAGELVPTLAKAYGECNLVFVIGGLRLDGARRTESVIANTLYASEINEYKKLKNPLGSDGYVIIAEEQLMVILPDEPEEIESIMQGAVSRYIRSVRV